MFSNFRFHSSLFFLSLTAIGYACQPSQTKGIIYDLIKTDSSQIDYMGEVHACDFHDGRGVIYNFRRRELVLFDSTGKILSQDTIPSEGPNSLSYISGLKILPDGNILANTLNGEIGVLNQDLQLNEKIIMPFPSGLSNMRSNVKIMDKWKDELFIHYPGRDGKNPYMKGYFKENKLLERINFTTGEARPFLELSPESQYQQDLYFEHPNVLLSIHENTLYFAFDNEPLIHLYNLEDNGGTKKTISLASQNFTQLEGQPIPVGNMEGSTVNGMIEGLYSFHGGVAVNFKEGINENALSKQGIQAVDDLALVQGLQNNILKIYHKDSGWSNEILLPNDIAYILNFESPEKPFYALNFTHPQAGNGYLRVIKLQLERNTK